MFKMKKYMLIIILFFLIQFIYLLINPTFVHAGTAGDNFLNAVTSGADTMISTGQNGLTSRGINVDLTPVRAIAQIVWMIGSVVMVAILIYKGARYATSSPGDKASLKRGLAGWIIMAVIVVGAFPLANLFVTSLDGSAGTANVMAQMQGTSQGLTGASANSPVMIIVNTIFRVIQVGAIGIVIIRFTYLGIKYFTENASGKADIKSGELVRSLIVAVIVFGAIGIFDILYNVIF